MSLEFPAVPGGALHRIEEFGLSGKWHWTFADGTLVWSPGLFRLLGLEPGRVRPSYDLLLALVHPDDRPALGTAAQVLRGEIPTVQSFRIVQLDGTVRHLAARHEIERAPDGRPVGVVGSLVSTADQPRLAGLLDAERRMRSLLYVQSGVLFFSVSPEMVFDYEPEAVRAIGLPFEAFNADPFLYLLPGERERLLDRAAEHRVSGRIFQDSTLYRRLQGDIDRSYVLVVPIRDAAGTVVGGRGLQYSPGLSNLPLPADMRAALEQEVRGAHLRAARALLDWSMTALAAASGLSLSTVRRLEEDAPFQSERSRHRAIDALRRAGIRLTMLHDGTIAVSRL